LQFKKKVVVSFVIIFGTLSFPVAGRTCGSPAVEPSLQSALSRRIVGGVEARKNSWPWQCLIQLDLGYGATRKCGGSVVDNRHVLTAAHCL